MTQNKLQIPHPSGTAEYGHCRYLCAKYGKPWPALTDEEKTARYRKNPSEMTASTEKVLAVLKPGEYKTHAEIVESTGVCPRTVRTVIKRLKTKGLIVDKFNFRDARSPLYRINPQVQEKAQPGAVA